MNSPLISIIIPLFNREHLVVETLNSIIAQTYQNWECIVVDDGSIDNSFEVVTTFVKTEPRIKVLRRPPTKLKGANACRNLGFLKSKGDYVIYFDSDDLMKPKCLEEHLNAILTNKASFSVSKFNYLNDNEKLSKADIFDNYSKFKINGKNFLKQNIVFITMNALWERSILEKISWNETLQSGQEYNYFCKVLTSNRSEGAFIDTELSEHRIHKDSIQSLQNKRPVIYLANKLDCYYKTMLDAYLFLEKDELVFLLNNCLSFYFRITKYKGITYRPEIRSYLSNRMNMLQKSNFICSLLLKATIDKGHFFYRKSMFKSIL